MTNREDEDGEGPKGRELALLLPDRHPQLDFFFCDIFDAAPKSDMASMAFPLFTLATKPDRTARRYEQGDNWIQITPTMYGRATVHDRDVLIYCISQCMAGLKAGRKLSRTLHLHAHHLLQVTNRQASGEGYKALVGALDRLQTTQIKTNIMTGGTETMSAFGFIDSYETVRATRDGRMIELSITLSDWIFNAIREKAGDILTIHRDYFRLRKPLERRLYELARKHCGRNAQWSFTMKTLHERTGSSSTTKEFQRLIRKIVEDNAAHRYIPDYDFALEGGTLRITPRREFLENGAPRGAAAPGDTVPLRVRPSTYDKAKSLAPGFDIYAIEADWHRFQEGKERPNSPDAAFIGFVKAWMKNNAKS